VVQIVGLQVHGHSIHRHLDAGAGAGAKPLTPLQMLELLEKNAEKAATALTVIFL
jgi:hypothetical protein